MTDAVIRFTAGNPTDEEIAAIVAVLTARSAARPAESEPLHHGNREGGWAAYWRTVGAPLQPGPGSWQAAVRGW